MSRSPTVNGSVERADVQQYCCPSFPLFHPLLMQHHQKLLHPTVRGSCRGQSCPYLCRIRGHDGPATWERPTKQLVLVSLDPCHKNRPKEGKLSTGAVDPAPVLVLTCPSPSPFAPSLPPPATPHPLYLSCWLACSSKQRVKCWRRLSSSCSYSQQHTECLLQLAQSAQA